MPKIIIEIDCKDNLCYQCIFCRGMRPTNTYCVTFTQGEPLEMSEAGNPLRCKECLDAEIGKESK